MSARNYLLLLFLITGISTSAQIRLPKLVGDHMVIQRDQKLKLWGWAGKREKLNITIAGSTYKTRCDKGGNFSVEIPPLPAGGPLNLVIEGKNDTRIVSDILVGDVWVCSGQSNMEWVLRNTKNGEKAMESANDPKIRHFKIPRIGATTPQDTLAGGEWEVAGPGTVGNFTAVGYYFAQEIRKATGVPIGLINTSWGGSRIEPWMNASSLGYADPQQLMDSLQQEEKKQVEAMEKILREKLGAIPESDLGMKGDVPIWQAPDLNDSDWEFMELPGLWEQKGWGFLDGFAWYRKTITLTAEQAAKKASIGLAMIDDNDITWVNGTKVGTTDSYNELRKYEIPVGILHAGKNKIVIRVHDTGGGGGVYGEAETMFVDLGDETISLAGDWKFKVGFVNKAPASAGQNQQPTLLYNFMIHPIIWYPIKGALWYQGESNAGGGGQAEAYAGQFKSMISLWRDLWGIGDFPFLYVQLANFMQNPDQPENSNWATLRESQTAALELPNTAQAVIIDIGEANDIHPRNKTDVGHRLALAARQMTYGEKNLEYSGPVCTGLKINGNKAVLEFEHIGSGLTTKRDKYGYVRGFAVAGADGKYVWAKAMIDGDKVVVWNEAVDHPKMVRYAWSDNPDDANLYNQEGLPAGPFRIGEK
ncbi:MAG: sialate O-acetylesterase [Lewinella sp.]|nr:sialate O-acetylesterase [Lewinella sp.]